jgi:hypothetical protein
MLLLRKSQDFNALFSSSTFSSIPIQPSDTKVARAVSLPPPSYQMIPALDQTSVYAWELLPKAVVGAAEECNAPSPIINCQTPGPLASASP